MNQRLKIAYIVNRFPSISETFILNQITDIISRGHTVKVYSFQRAHLSVVHNAFESYNLAEKTVYFSMPKSKLGTLGLLFKYILRGRIPLSVIIKSLGLGDRAMILTALKDVSLKLQVSQFIEQNEFDIVHAHFGQRGAVVADTMSADSKFKLVTTFHGYDLAPNDVGFNRDRYRVLFDRAAVLTVNSPYLRSVLLRVNPSLRNVQLMPMGLRTDQYRRSNSIRHESDFRILFCGRLIEVKAPDLAVIITSVLVNGRGFKNVSLSVIGDGPLREKVDRLIHQLGVEEHVTMLGTMSQEMVISEMERSHVLLLPGIYERETGRAETQGLVLQEAQSMCLPVITSDAGGAKYGVLDGRSGFVVPAGDVDAFADKLELLIRNESLRGELGTAGREYVIKNFDTVRLGNDLENLYLSLR